MIERGCIFAYIKRFNKIVVADIWLRKTRYLNQKISIINFGDLSKLHAISIEEVDFEIIFEHILLEAIQKLLQKINNQLYWDASIFDVQKSIQWDFNIIILLPKIKDLLLCVFMVDFEVFDKTRERFLIVKAYTFQFFSCLLFTYCNTDWKGVKKGLFIIVWIRNRICVPV